MKFSTSRVRLLMSQLNNTILTMPLNWHDKRSASFLGFAAGSLPQYELCPQQITIARFKSKDRGGRNRRVNCKRNTWFAWGLSEHPHMSFWTLTFTFNVNHTSSEKTWAPDNKTLGYRFLKPPAVATSSLPVYRKDLQGSNFIRT
jgi:hypothetical protein